MQQVSADNLVLNHEFNSKVTNIPSFNVVDCSISTLTITFFLQPKKKGLAAAIAIPIAVGVPLGLLAIPIVFSLALGVLAFLVVSGGALAVSMS